MTNIDQLQKLVPDARSDAYAVPCARGVPPSVPIVMRGLVQRLVLAPDAKPNRIMVFIAARSGEGTSTVAEDYVAALAAETQQKVLLLDTGKLNPERFMAHGIDPTLGMVDALALNMQHTQAVHPVSENVFISRWVGRDENRSLAGKLARDASFWQSMRALFHTIVIDAPALETSFDGVAFAARADATILIVEAESTRRQVIERLHDTLRDAGANLVGLVMNKRRFYIPGEIYRRL
ncbi:MAG: hypothetical protein WBK91_03395 [Alphaproteobacteria bacterium]